MNLFNKKEKEPNQNPQAVKRTRSGNSNEETILEEKIKKEELEINEAIKEVGKIYYESYRNEDHYKLLPICNMIDESYKIIGICEKQIMLLKGIQICQNCKATLDLESLFCKKCGTKLDVVEEIKMTGKVESTQQSTSVELVKCHECGSTMPSDLAFCTNCGVKLKSL
jgi:ribosomal protein L40E